MVVGLILGAVISMGPDPAPEAALKEAPAAPFFRAELEPVYRGWVGAPGEMLSVLDNLNDLEDCKARVDADATVGICDLAAALRSGDGLHTPATGTVSKQRDTIAEAGVLGQIFVGERNNPFFTYYPEEFGRDHPEAFMRDKDGAFIEITSNPIRNVRNRVPAVDDPTIMRLASDLIRAEVASVGDDRRIRGWFIGTEEAYPDYFALPVGDFREASVAHYEALAARLGLPLPVDPETIVAEAGSPAKAAWYRFREQAMADRASAHMQSFLSVDRIRPVMYPTHGHPFAGDMRRKLGQPPALLAGACDGFEMGHITIDGDDESLNLVYLANFTAFGVPVVAPRLGNKTLDPTAKGGGRSFTPAMLRRLVYECLGMGVWHIGPIHWRAILGDGEWAIKDTPAEQECAAVFSEIQRLRPILAGMSRLQPAVALYVSDDTWLEAWNPRWTAFLQDAFAAHLHVTLVNDALLGADLAARVPALVSLENTRLSDAARQGLAAYVAAGGHVYAWGDLGTEDELGRPAAPPDLEVVGMDLVPDTAERTVVHQFQTGEGAWQWPHRFRPVRLDDVTAFLKRDLPGHRIRPIEVVTPDSTDLEVFPLTDGVSLAVVLINRRDRAIEAQVQAADGLLPPGRPWQVENALEPGTPLAEAGGPAAVTVAAHGTAVLWIHPAARADEAAADARAAIDILAGWQAAGADTAPFDPMRRALDNAAETEGLAAKAWGLAEVIRGSWALRAEAVVQPDGALAMEASVLDADGEPAAGGGVRVRVRIVPGPFGWHALEPGADGVYRLTVPRDRLPRVYDFDRRTYEPLHGPARLVFTAHDGRRAGGAMLVRDLPREPED